MPVFFSFYPIITSASLIIPYASKYFSSIGIRKQMLSSHCRLIAHFSNVPRHHRGVLSYLLYKITLKFHIGILFDLDFINCNIM